MNKLHRTIAFGVGCMVSLGIATTACSGAGAGSTSQTNAPKKKGSGELDRVMRTRMNTAYSSLVFQILHSTSDYDYDKVFNDSKELAKAVQSVRALPFPAVAESEEARSVYTTFNDNLQAASDKFGEAIARKDRPQMEALLTRIGDTCNDCHRFFRIEIDEDK